MSLIALYQIDGSKYAGVRYPNIALMKISAYHKENGDIVEWYDGIMFAEKYDKIYASKIFDFTPMPEIPSNMIVGGTGIDFYNKLPAEIEEAAIDWSIYPDIPFHLGFTSKGCRFNCDFCCVPKKEGKPYSYNDIDELLTNPNGKNNLMLLDNDFFGNPNWRENILKIKELDLKVCFTQGINIRVITKEQAAMLANIKYYNHKFNKRYLSFAWDNIDDERAIMRGIFRCLQAGIYPQRMQFYVLIGFNSTPEQDLYRVNKLRELGCKPYVMPYNKNDTYQKSFARYVNNRIIFNSCAWEDYKYNPYS